MKKKWIVLLLMFILFFPYCGKRDVKPDILLITIDTLRRDHLGVYGYPRQTSPFIDSLAKKGVIFKKVVTPIPATSGSHASILTSLHPLTHQVTGNGLPLSRNVRTIAEVMKANGYYTVGAVAVRILSSKYKFSRGFDSFSDKWDTTIKYNKTNQRIARDVNKSVFEQIDNYRLNHKEKPLFIWVHYFDPHYGYINWKHIRFDEPLPDRYLEKTAKIRRSIEKYDKEIYYVDTAIKELFKYLKEKGLDKKMVTCITADHGEQHGDHGWGNGHADFYSETILVPLIFYGYRIPQNKSVDAFVSTMDIGVTLLEMAHLKFEYPTEGKNLLDLMDNPLSTRQREFLIIGYPRYARSLQLIRTPYSYILNFDRWLKHWFFSENNDIHIPEHRFKRIKKEAIKSVYFKKSDKYKIRIHLPRVRGKGLFFAVFRFDLKRNEGCSVGFEVEPHLSSKALPIDKNVKQVNLYYPVTVLDELSVVINKKELTILDNLRYTFISKDEFLKYNIEARKIKNKIFNGLLTKRKNKKSDEFFDLTNDIGMLKNLVHNKNHAKNILRSNQSIYKLFSSYINKKKGLFKKTKKAKKLTKKQKEMLKSLGYL